MKKVLLCVALISALILVGCNNKEEVQENNNVNQGQNQSQSQNKGQENIATNIKDFITGEQVEFKDSLEGISSDGKTYKFNDEIGEKEIQGFEGTVKSVVYIHDEQLVKDGTLGILNTEGQVYISNGGLWAPKIYVSPVIINDKVKSISATSSYKNDRGVVLMLTEDGKVKAADDDNMEAYDFSLEEEIKFSDLYEIIVENGRMWTPVFTINPQTNEKIFFEEQISTLMFNDGLDVMFEDAKTNEYKNGTYEIEHSTGNVKITYDDNSTELYRYVDNLGDNEVYLVITNAEGLDVYYRQ